MAETAINETNNTVQESAPSKLKVGRLVVWAVVAVVLIFLLLGLAAAFAPPPENAQAPDFTMPLYGGGEFTLSDYRGQVVMINFWASWCAPCKEEAPDLQRAWLDYQGKGVQFIGVDYVDAERNAMEYLEEFQITYPNGADLGTKISDVFRIKGVPETFIVNRDGKVVFYRANPITYEMLTAEIDKALADTSAE